ncbi:hypothetical protein O181_027606 [Austropuccinia psidii MF-1]|uniref:Uncharacterized protein n=1 Tax=Austropuccinia psidii MF-1 TaxID=1389203 RepID=A0A9Q3CMN3_9BASI|nr:hypothetical protein [Austropuccinia psidii MF-1]
MSQKHTNHSIQNVQLCHHHVGRGNGPYAPPRTGTPPTPADAQAHTPHPRYCVAGSTSVIRKMTIPQRRSTLMDHLVRSNPPLHQDWLKDLFDVCVWKQAGIV